MAKSVVASALFALLFQLFGTLFLVYTISVSANNPLTVLLCLWIWNLLGYRISSAHFNPAITFAAFFRRTSGHFEKKIGLLYILFQCAGAFAGALFAWLESGHTYLMAVYDDDKIFQALLIQIIGTFAYTLIYMISTDPKTKLTQDDVLNSLVIAISLALVITWGLIPSGACYNPAVGLFLNLVRLFDTGKGRQLKYVWIYIIFPLVGSFLSVIFHEFVFKNALEAIGSENKNQGEDDGERIGASFHPQQSTSSFDGGNRRAPNTSQSSFKANPNPMQSSSNLQSERSQPLIKE